MLFASGFRFWEGASLLIIYCSSKEFEFAICHFDMWHLWHMWLFNNSFFIGHRVWLWCWILMGILMDVSTTKKTKIHEMPCQNVPMISYSQMGTRSVRIIWGWSMGVVYLLSLDPEVAPGRQRTPAFSAWSWQCCGPATAGHLETLTTLPCLHSLLAREREWLRDLMSRRSPLCTNHPPVKGAGQDACMA